MLRTLLVPVLTIGVAAFVGCAPAVRLPGGTGAEAQITWLIFADGLHIAFRNTGHVRNQLRSLTSGLIGPRDAFVMRFDGPSALGIDGRGEPGVLDALIPRFAGAGLKPSEVAAAPDGRFEIGYRFRIAVDAAERMFAEAARHPSQRRVMLYLSDGYHVAGAARRLAAFARAARRARTVVFALNTRVFAASTRFEDAVAEAEYTKATEASLRAIVAGTGGEVLLNAVDLPAAVPRIRAAVFGATVPAASRTLR